jgi:hypothetical protein
LVISNNLNTSDKITILFQKNRPTNFAGRIQGFCGEKCGEGLHGHNLSFLKPFPQMIS